MVRAQKRSEGGWGTGAHSADPCPLGVNALGAKVSASGAEVEAPGADAVETVPVANMM
jgi:hypothetical protein